MTLNVVLDLSPFLKQLVTDFFNKQEAQIMATIAEFKKTVLDRIAEMQQKSADEQAQVLAAMDALKAQIGGIVADVADVDVAEVNAAFDVAIQGVGNIFTPAAAAARKK